MSIAKSKDMDDVYKLVHDEYVIMKYCDPQPDGMFKHYPHLDNISATSVFIIKDDEKIVGTNSITLDSPAGLPVDEDFPKEVQKIRQECQSNNIILASSWRLVTCTQARRNGFTMFMFINLIEQTIKTAIERNVNTCLFIVNPKHKKFYHKFLGLETIIIGNCHSVDAPAVFMKTTVKEIVKMWAKLCDKRKIDDTVSPLYDLRMAQR